MRWAALAVLVGVLNVVEGAVVGVPKHGAVAKVPLAVVFSDATPKEEDLPAPTDVVADVLSDTELWVSWFYPPLPELNVTEACPTPTTVTSTITSTITSTTNVTSDIPDTSSSTVDIYDVTVAEGRDLLETTSAASPPTPSDISSASTSTEATPTTESPRLEFEVKWSIPDGIALSYVTVECQYVVADLTPATNYTIVVTALYGDLQSRPSEEVTAQTMEESSSNLGLILGLSIGIPLGVLCLLVAGYFAYKHFYLKENGRDKEQKLQLGVIKNITPAEMLQKQFQEKFLNMKATKSTKIAKNFPSKNRYRNILPYDDTLVRLKEVDYINASYVLDRKFIATQDPMADQVDDFWQLIWECDVRVIIRLSSDVPEQPVAIYVKDAGEGRWVMGHDELDVTVTDENTFGPLQKKTLQVSQGDTRRTIHHYHMLHWSNKAVPDPQELLGLVMVGRSSRAKLGPTSPVLVHCGAGVGRTGTLIALWHMIDLASEGKMYNLVRVVEAMRKDRMAMVQTLEQYVLVDKCMQAHLDGSFQTDNYEILN
ncbi:tyrosine-protein phosphatase 10D-like [Penaeus japonicus]|uniref:tyrosine-protein phosphatase 10D-like n=1 Tax=Penaeus japonicus TaxID=27405 RepID=UPI001C70DB42|nr:tyrosine-protein phosphatase 10D-like [Penaeus japonicus]